MFALQAPLSFARAAHWISAANRALSCCGVLQALLFSWEFYFSGLGNLRCRNVKAGSAPWSLSSPPEWRVGDCALAMGYSSMAMKHVHKFKTEL